MAMLAGLFFGIWPLFMNRSGHTGNVSSAVFCVATFIVVLPFAVKSILGGAPLVSANWLMVLGAGFFGALGLLAFNYMLAGATKEAVGSLFIIMVMVYVAVPALYQIIVTGGLPLTKLAGFIAAAIAAYLLM